MGLIRDPEMRLGRAEFVPTSSCGGAAGRGADHRSLASFNGPTFRLASWIGIAVAGLGLFFALIMGWWIACVWLGALLLYSLWQVAWEHRLPDLFDLLLVAAAVLNALGWAFDLFHKFGSYDVLAHGYTIFAITLTAGFLAYSSPQVRFDRIGWLFVTSIFCFGLALGGLWEIVEWVFGVVGGIDDTIADLTMDAVGAGAAGLLSGWFAHEERRLSSAVAAA